MSETENKQKQSRMDQKFIEHKLLSEGIQTRINAVRLNEDNKPIIILDSNERGFYAVQLESVHDPSNRDDLVTLYRMFAIDPEDDISELEGRTVTISYSDNSDEDELTVKCNGMSVNGTIEENIVDYRKSSKLNDNQRTSLRIGYNNEATDGLIDSYRIEDVNINGSSLEVVTPSFAEVFDEDYSYSDNPNTPYEKLIEYVGSGSIQNLEGSEIYVASKDNIFSRSHEIELDKLPNSWKPVCETENDRMLFASKPENNNFYQSKLLSKITPSGFALTILTLIAMILIDIWIILTHSSSEISIYSFILVFTPIIPALLLIISARGYFID